MSPVELSDVAVRARGIERHLLEPQAVHQLARSSGLGVLAGALQRAGYWPAPTSGVSALSAVQLIDATIEHETGRRFGVLLRWLADRRHCFAAVFEDEERRALRMYLRGLAGGAPVPAAVGWAVSPRLRGLLARLTEVASYARALARVGHPYAESIAAAHHASGDDVMSLERALDHAYSERALASARRIGGPLLAWVEEGIDLENAWEALAGGAEGTFLPGGGCLTREQHRDIASAPEQSARRRQLTRVFAGGPLAGPFSNPALPLASLEAEAQAARARTMRGRARLDPLGAAPILEVVMRLRIERSNLRCINWGIALGLPCDAIMAGMATAP